MEISFTDLIPGMEYEIHVGLKHHYRGTFNRHVDNLAYFDPLIAIFSKGTVEYAQGQYFQAHRMFKKIETHTTKE